MASTSVILGMPSAADVDALKNESGFKWVHASSAARLAQAVTAADRGKLSFQTDIARVYRLRSVSPVQWTQLPADDISYDMRGNVFIANSTTGPRGLGYPDGGNNPGGTATARAPTAGGTKGDASLRFGYPTSAVAGQEAFFRPSNVAARLAPPSVLSSRFFFRWTSAQRNAGMRWFVGVQQTFSGAITSYTNCIGVGREAESNINLFYNDGVGSTSKVDFGAAFPAIANSNQLQELELYLTATSYGYCYRNLDANTEISGAVTTDLGDISTGQPCILYGNVATAAAVALDGIFIGHAEVIR